MQALRPPRNRFQSPPRWLCLSPNLPRPLLQDPEKVEAILQLKMRLESRPDSHPQASEEGEGKAKVVPFPEKKKKKWQKWRRKTNSETRVLDMAVKEHGGRAQTEL